MNQMSKLDAFIQQAVTAMPISGTSLIASLYGDALLQRGGEVWLGSVAALLEGLGFGERFVRTALFRLNKEEWLDVVRIGRRSFYRLSDKGLRLTRRAEHKIYRASAPEWDGTWLLLLSEGLEKNVLADVKKQLLWQGLARWRRACWPRRRKSWPMSSLCSTKRASLKMSSVLKPIRRWRSPERPCAAGWRSAGISPNKMRCTRRLSPCSDLYCRCCAIATRQS